MPTTITNPILNSPFREPTRHFEFDSDGITSTVIEGRRLSTYFVPIPQARQRTAAAASAKGGASPGQQTLPGDWTAERMETSETINRIRAHVDAWRRAGRPQVTPTTRDLLAYWNREDRERRLFFCQVEALETAIYLTEVAPRAQPWIEQALRDANLARNPGLERIAFKMATGSGKTVVMAMLIAWHTLNKLDRPTDDRFGDTFLVVTPGITIRDRLRVLLPNAPDSYYRALDLLPDDQLDRLEQATVVITNFHGFLRRETLTASATTKRLLAPDDPDRFKEPDGQMVRRVLRAVGGKRNVIVLNDEAHHCYQAAPKEEREQRTLTADERTGAAEAERTAAVWLNGLRAVRQKVGVRAIYDLSATPFFLRGSGYKEGTLFPWVVSDFSLIDAIESGIVKIPRVPVADDSMTGAGPTYRELWSRIGPDMSTKGRDADTIAQGTPLNRELEGALVSLYGHYRRSFEAWQMAGQGLPPVFIVVCQNTSISKQVSDWIAGYQRRAADGTPLTTDAGDPVLAPGNLDLFSNVERGADGANSWTTRPRTLLIDSAQLESGEAMDPAFRKAAAAELAEFREALRLRTGAGTEVELTDEDILREVMNTVGKPGRLGESIRCVVSVSMLTEGWDANTVTHILGVRAFGTQLLCEQVVGRGLRRLSYEADAEGMFEPEYAEVYGVPFSFIPTTGDSTPAPIKPYHRVMALAERAHLAIAFPRVTGYRYELPRTTLRAAFTPASTFVLSTRDLPDRTVLDPIVGGSTETSLDDLRAVRRQRVAFVLAKRTMEGHLADVDGKPQPWLFPEVLGVTEQWLERCIEVRDGGFLQMLLIAQNAALAAEMIQAAIVRGTAGTTRLLPIYRPYDPIGSTDHVDFTTTKDVYETRKSHLNFVVADSGWEGKLGLVLDDMPEVIACVKNQGLDFRVPYSFEGGAANYVPDFLVRIDDGREDTLNVIIEVSGEARRDKAAKVDAARTFWVPAMNNDGRHGRWSFLEVTDPWDAAALIRAHIAVPGKAE